jgi:hypothetical protein
MFTVLQKHLIIKARIFNFKKVYGVNYVLCVEWEIIFCSVCFTGVALSTCICTLVLRTYAFFGLKRFAAL